MTCADPIVLQKVWLGGGGGRGAYIHMQLFSNLVRLVAQYTALECVT